LQRNHNHPTIVTIEKVIDETLTVRTLVFSDSVSVKFVTKYYKKNHTMPSFVRKSWKPILKILDNN